MKLPPARRAYTMGRRAQQVREVGERILSIVQRDFLPRYLDEVTLDEIAAATGVTVQTLLRRYGSKEGLFTAAAGLLGQDFTHTRRQVQVGDVAAAVRELVQGYERNGESVLRGLHQEERVAAVRPFVEAGRRHHHAWVARVFAPWLDARAPRARTRLHARLVAALDVYTWKLMRRDLGLSAKETEQAIRETVEPMLGTSPTLSPRRSRKKTRS